MRIKILELANLVDAQRKLSMSRYQRHVMLMLQVHCSCAWCLGPRGA